MTAVPLEALSYEEIPASWGVSARYYEGDARLVLANLDAGTVQTVVTSPPYFHGRLYPAPDLVWDDDSRRCPQWYHHTWAQQKTYYPASPAGTSTADSFATAGIVNLKRLAKGRWIESERCTRCGAWKGQLGLETTPREYVKHLLEVFKGVHRVMKDDATLWLNLGDNYAGAGYANHSGTGGARREAGGRQKHNTVPNARTKSLLGIPWMVAFALQETGFLLRSDIIWQKPDGMYEPVNDRPVKTYEHVFLFSKNGKYYYNPKANPAPKVTGEKDAWGQVDAIKNGGDVWRIPVQASRSSHNATMPELLAQKCIRAGSREGDLVLDPFGGAGTTALVALCNGRHGASIELVPQYHAEAKAAAVAVTDAGRELPELRRAAGSLVCELCGLTYRRHPMAHEVPGYGGSEGSRPFLNRLCNGELVKL